MKEEKMTKQLFLSSPVQVALLKEVIIPEFSTGFWKNHRPSNHAAQWADVEILVSQDDKLGMVNFTVPRLYNFVNPDFIKPNEAKLVAVAQSVKPSSNFRSVKKELIEMSRIVGGRLTDKKSEPTKANRGNNKVGTIQETVSKAKQTVKKATDGVKRTVTKKKDDGVTVQKTSSGATVRRVPIIRSETTE